MKIRTFILAFAAMAVGLSSCSKFETGDSNRIAEDGKPTVANIELTQSVMSRAFEGASPQDAEKLIDQARIYIFGPDRILAKIVTPVVADNNLSASAQVELTTGDHYFYATVNIPSSQFEGIQVGKSTIGNFEDKIFDITSISTVATGGKFWMTNLSKPAAVKLVEATKEDAFKNEININIGRAVAKVCMDFAPHPDEQLDGELSNVEFRVRNNPKQMYSVPFIQENTVWISPYYNNSQITGSYFDSTDDFIAAGSNTYAVENSNATPRQGNSTYLSIKGTFTPDKAIDLAGDDAVLTGGTFWRIANLDTDGNAVSYESEYYAVEPVGKAGEDQAIVEYPAGTCYYGLWIVDNSSTELFMVKRNTYYWVTIVSVNGAGANEEGKVVVDDNKKLDEEAWINANIVIRDWSVVEQAGGI